MLEEYENWEDSVRRTFIELADFQMKQHSNPLDYLIECCEHAIQTGHWKLDKFTVLNAKDELKRLREAKKDLAHDLFMSNQQIVELINDQTK